MVATEAVLVNLPKAVIDHTLSEFPSVKVLGSRLEENGHLLCLEGEVDELCSFICEAANMEFGLSEMFERGWA